MNYNYLRPYRSILTASPSENWRRPPGRPRTTWMKTIQQDLRSNINNLSLDEAITVAQNRPLWRLVSVVLATREEEEMTIHSCCTTQYTPLSRSMMLGSRWTGRISSSVSIWRPHSGLLWHSCTHVNQLVTDTHYCHTGLAIKHPVTFRPD